MKNLEYTLKTTYGVWKSNWYKIRDFFTRALDGVWGLTKSWSGINGNVMPLWHSGDSNNNDSLPSTLVTLPLLNKHAPRPKFPLDFTTTFAILFWGWWCSSFAAIAKLGAAPWKPLWPQLDHVSLSFFVLLLLCLGEGAKRRWWG